jgi:hypothetical protein
MLDASSAQRSISASAAISAAVGRSAPIAGEAPPKIEAEAARMALTFRLEYRKFL